MTSPYTMTTSETLPASTEVVIIGGGIIGSCIALALAKRGVPAVVCEKGELGEEQSNRNWGWVRKMGRDIREIPLMVKSMQLWAGLNQATGEETGFRIRGITYFGDTDADLARYGKWLDAVKPFNLDTRTVTSDEITKFAPGATKRWLGGLHTASDGFAEPHLATLAIAKGARKLGAQVFTGCAVRGIETSGGRVCGVVTERGSIKCKSVVLAGGTWSSLFCRNLDVVMPQLKLLSQLMRTDKVDGGPEGCGSGRGFGFRKRLDGGYNISMRSAHPVDIVPDSFRFLPYYRQALRNEWRAMKFRIGKRTFQELMLPTHWKLDRKTPFEAIRILRPEPAHKILDQAQINFRQIFPAFANMKVVDRIGAWIDVSPDAIPVISQVDSVPGFYISTGYSGHGFGIAPGAGELMAQLVTGEQPIVDPKPFRHSRYIDGSPIVHWPIGF